MSDNSLLGETVGEHYTANTYLFQDLNGGIKLEQQEQKIISFVNKILLYSAYKTFNVILSQIDVININNSYLDA